VPDRGVVVHGEHALPDFVRTGVVHPCCLVLRARLKGDRPRCRSSKDRPAGHGTKVQSTAKALDEALQRNWTVVDMKADWKRVYPYEK
jgi:hypothetical protein